MAQRIETRAGEVLAEPGERHRKMLVVLSGSLEILHARAGTARSC